MIKKITANEFIDQISCEIDNRNWRTQFGDARHRDQESLERLLDELMQNQDILFKQLFHKLDTQQTSFISMMSAMQKGILKLNVDDNRSTERRFLEHGVSLLQRRSGQSVKIESWFVSSLEVDKGDKVGSGGFSTVYKATFLGSPVAVKELAVTTSSKMLMNEIKGWERLRHPHILRKDIQVVTFMPSGSISNIFDRVLRREHI